MSDRLERLRDRIRERRVQIFEGPPPLSELPPCRHEGSVIEFCQTCANNEARHVRECDLFGRCTRGIADKAVAVCTSCHRYDPDVALFSPPPVGCVPGPVPTRRAAAWNQQLLAPGRRGYRFNPSICPDPETGGLLVAWRDGWAGSEIWVQRRNADLIGALSQPTQLSLWHAQASYGREDPRLFLHDGAPHVMYAGVMGRGGTFLYTNQLCARLGPGLVAHKPELLVYRERARWEKNWAPFEHEGRLFAVYHPNGHRIVELRGGQVETAFDGGYQVPWAGGEVRGGAPPIRVGSEYWHFFHDRVTTEYGLLVYRAGLYAFSAEYPFRPTRVSPQPLLSADPATKPADQYAAVCFPGGAVRLADKWLLAVGAHDRWSEVWEFSHADLEASLRPI